jgi:aminoacrylate peracid reductase
MFVHGYPTLGQKPSTWQRFPSSRQENIMAGTPLNPDTLPNPIAPYSMGIKADNTIYVSGIVAIDREGKTIGPNDVAAQTRHVIETISEILKAGGASIADITFNTIILKDLADYAKMNEVYREFFKNNSPARYCIGATLVRDDFLVEIASIAHISNR